MIGKRVIGKTVPQIMGLIKMNVMEKQKNIEKFILNHNSIVDFGTSVDAVSEEWINKAEYKLRRSFPESYKWFIRNYAGGEIGGDEIYSIYGIPFESVNGGDIVFQHLANQKSGLLDDEKLVISETDIGEIFFFDYSHLKDGECPIYLRLPSGEFEFYASDFYDFIKKRITAYL